MPPRLKPSSLLRLQRASLRGARSASAPPVSRFQLRSIKALTLSRQFLFTFRTTPSINNSSAATRRPFSSTPASSSPVSSTGKSQADLIVEELQELYETATDELEIATESTDSATIYAASDRESARDALNTLVAAFELYTTGAAPEAQAGGPQGKAEGEGNGEPGRLVELAIDPADVPDGVREEVRKRVGQRVREVKSAVENLEGRAHD
ncbi:hypothetical protein BJX68DRAFT_262912 [Aspergillus pseudodeflectus]|uniref:Uncharacterized protein n=1 Tax=Aspergillus pseudodeflectus TaxID=176178 RepID=A0ABR4L4I5_9EURO